MCPGRFGRCVTVRQLPLTSSALLGGNAEVRKLEFCSIVPRPQAQPCSALMRLIRSVTSGLASEPDGVAKVMSIIEL